MFSVKLKSQRLMAPGSETRTTWPYPASRFCGTRVHEIDQGPTQSEHPALSESDRVVFHRTLRVSRFVFWCLSTFSLPTLEMDSELLSEYMKLVWWISSGKLELVIKAQ